MKLKKITWEKPEDFKIPEGYELASIEQLIDNCYFKNRVWNGELTLMKPINKKFKYWMLWLSQDHVSFHLYYNNCLINDGIAFIVKKEEK